jgi:hypothetical protein
MPSQGNLVTRRLGHKPLAPNRTHWQCSFSGCCEKRQQPPNHRSTIARLANCKMFPYWSRNPKTFAGRLRQLEGKIIEPNGWGEMPATSLNHRRWVSVWKSQITYTVYVCAFVANLPPPPLRFIWPSLHKRPHFSLFALFRLSDRANRRVLVPRVGWRTVMATTAFCYRAFMEEKCVWNWRAIILREIGHTRLVENT